jgi:type IV pilus assembly protein PilX
MTITTPSVSNCNPSLTFVGKANFRSRQAGVVLLIALVAVFMLMLAGLATLRSVGTTTLLTGNLAFREATVQSADYGLEDARNRLIVLSTATPSSLFSNISGEAYVANWDDTFDPRTYNWGNAVTVATAPVGFQIKYVIHRMCKAAGSFLISGASCVMASTAASQGDSKGSLSYGSFNLFGLGAGTPYYRITTRVVGPRNSESFVQAMVY